MYNPLGRGVQVRCEAEPYCSSSSCRSKLKGGICGLLPNAKFVHIAIKGTPTSQYNMYHYFEVFHCFHVFIFHYLQEIREERDIKRQKRREEKQREREKNMQAQKKSASTLSTDKKKKPVPSRLDIMPKTGSASKR